MRDVFQEGQVHRSLPPESRIFYQKLDLDMNRYRLEVCKNRVRQPGEKHEHEHDEIEYDLD